MPVVADLTDLFPVISDAEAYAQLVADLPTLPGGAVYNTREGSVVHGFLGAFVNERRRWVGYTQEALRQTFLLYATGDYLDARSNEVGVVRGPAVGSAATLTFTGTNGTLIPAGSTFATEGDSLTGNAGVTFATENSVTITAGVATVTARSLQAGTIGNVGADTITIPIAAPAGITTVTNPAPALGGLDEQTDESLRQEALSRAAVFPESGNANFYRVTALEYPEVGAVQVTDRWLGAGTGLVAVGGAATPYVTPAVVDSLQLDFDPSILVLAHFEGAGEVWIGDGATSTADPIEGSASMRLTPAISATEQMTLMYDTPIDLSDWSSPDDELWLFLRRVSVSTTISQITVALLHPSGEGTGKVEATVSAATINALANITTRARLVLTRSQFATTGTFSWANVGGVKITLTATGTGAAEMDFDGLRIRRSAGGLEEGRAPLGVQITVRSARSLTINVDADLTLRPGITLSDVDGPIQSQLASLFASIPPGGTVYVTEVGNVLHDTTGVVDYSNINLNGAAANITLDAEARPLMGSLALS